MSERDCAEDIKYVLTDKGRFDLQMALIEDELAMCDHRWEIVRRGLLACMKCGTEHRPTRAAPRASDDRR